MAESIDKPKKTKAPAKPRASASAADGTAKAAASKKASTRKATEQPAPRIPSHEEIAHLARQYWAERGHTDGHAEQDWLRAERELMKQAS
jgi:hypothetical protein